MTNDVVRSLDNLCKEIKDKAEELDAMGFDVYY